MDPREVLRARWDSSSKLRDKAMHLHHIIFSDDPIPTESLEVLWHLANSDTRQLHATVYTLTEVYESPSHTRKKHRLSVTANK